ncbi:MAG: deoxyribose-phosphate aldolase [Firmicutes bacterium]|nr:deoxyribose-phosphate aldolase [Bacillota bacterium]
MSVNLAKYDRNNIGKLFELSQVRPTNTEEEVRQGCRMAVKYNLRTMYSSTLYWADVLKEELAGSTVYMGTGCCNENGDDTIKAQICEAEAAVKLGYSQIDFCVNTSALLDHKYDFLRSHLNALRGAVGPDICLKGIIEVCFLTNTEIQAISELFVECGINYVKTSLGLWGGPTVDNVRFIRKVLGDSNVGIKMAGIKAPRPQNTYAYLLAGADIVGTRAAPAIIDGLENMRKIGIVPAYNPD